MCIPSITALIWKLTVDIEIFRDLDFSSYGILDESWTGLAHTSCGDSDKDTSDDAMKEHGDVTIVGRDGALRVIQWLSDLYIYSQNHALNVNQSQRSAWTSDIQLLASQEFVSQNRFPCSGIPIALRGFLSSFRIPGANVMQVSGRETIYRSHGLLILFLTRRPATCQF